MGADTGFPVYEGVPTLLCVCVCGEGGCNLQHGPVLEKMYVKTKELGAVEGVTGRPLDPPKYCKNKAPFWIH